MNKTVLKLAVVMCMLAFGGFFLLVPKASSNNEDNLNQQLQEVLNQHGFTGRIEQKLEQKLGRKVDKQLADIGRLAFHDPLLSLSNQNSCAGCHAAPAGFGDTQSIAIGVENNGIVGKDRAGPRNQRRSPMLLNNVFYPTLMWNSRFASGSGDPFDNSAGFHFPLPEGDSLSNLSHLLTAQAFIPVTEKPEMAGFGADLPTTNDGIREAVIERLNSNGNHRLLPGNKANYRELFGRIFPEVKRGAPITYEMLARAIAEFEFTLVFADAPIDKFARGQSSAMTEAEKRGALLFFGKANCVQCHSVSGQSNEMFSDFKQHVIGVPQIAPAVSNVTFDGAGANEDFGLEQVTGSSADRYAFRTSPLRNVALQPTFFHNGSFTNLEDAIRHHLNVYESANNYNPATAGIDIDLQGAMGPIQTVLMRVDSLLQSPTILTEEEFQWLSVFVRNGLHDKRATPQNLRKLIPTQLPSGKFVHIFQ